jgi:hypothetical protein
LSFGSVVSEQAQPHPLQLWQVNYGYTDSGVVLMWTSRVSDLVQPSSRYVCFDLLLVHQVNK